MPTIERQEKPIDPADIGPDDLWVVWIHSIPLLQDLGDGPVRAEWALAPRGEEGLRALGSDKGFGKYLLATAPVSALQQMRNVLALESPSGIPGWIRQVLVADRQLIFVQDARGSTRVVSSYKDLREGEREVLRGSRKDLLSVLREGEKILRERDWKKVFSDHRDFVKHGEVGWLNYQHNPEGAEMLKEMLERRRRND